MNDLEVVGDYGGMSNGVEHCPAKDWRWKNARLALVGEKFVDSGHTDLMRRPVDLGYVPGESGEVVVIDITKTLGQLVIANDLVEIGD